MLDRSLGLDGLWLVCSDIWAESSELQTSAMLLGAINLSKLALACLHEEKKL